MDNVMDILLKRDDVIYNPMDLTEPAPPEIDWSNFQQQIDEARGMSSGEFMKRYCVVKSRYSIVKQPVFPIKLVPNFLQKD